MAAPENKHHSLALAAGLVTLLIWSGTPIANKIAIGHMDGLTAGVLRSLLAGILAFVIARSLKFPFPRSGSDRLLLLASGIPSFAIWPILISVGLERTSVGHAALLMALVPIFTVLAGSLVNRRQQRPGWWLGASFSLAATAVLIFAKEDLRAPDTTGATIEGDLIILLGALVCGLGYVAGGKLSPKIGTMATTFWGLSVALVILFPVFLAIVSNTSWAEVAMPGWYAIAWMALLSSLVGYAMWFYALGHGGITRMGSILLALPVTTLLSAYLILNEVVTPFMMLICACIIVGTFYAQKYAR